MSIEQKDFKVVDGYPNYAVSKKGEVINTLTGIKLKPHINEWGYRRVTLFLNGKRKKFFVHRLMGFVFIPNPENKPVINHINGITHDNRIENLEWCTVGENLKHAWKLGLKKTTEGVKRNCLKQSRALQKPVLDLKTGVFYNSIIDAAIHNNQDRSKLSDKLRGKIKNNTSLILV